MVQLPFSQIDVFSDVAFGGNPLAVVVGADRLSTEQMQQIASWTNLSETTFLLAPRSAEADYRVRIFTTSTELPFAGHPTLGSAAAWLAHGGQAQNPGTLVQECAAGLVTVTQDGARFAFAAPPLTRYEPVDEETVARVAAGLGLSRAEVLDASWVDNGPGWLAARLTDAATVLRTTPDRSLLRELKVGVVGAHEPGTAGVDFEVRAFLASGGEDPVTGSLNAGIARWLIDSGVAPQTFVAAQGTVLGRTGRVYVTQGDTHLWIGGDTQESLRGTISIP